MFTRRTERVGQLILSELAEVMFKRVKDPRLQYIILTRVDVSPDFSQAKVFFSLFDQTFRREAEQGLNSAIPFLRRILASRLHLKAIPRLIPIFDQSLAQEFYLEEIIRRVRQVDEIAVKNRDKIIINKDNDNNR